VGEASAGYAGQHWDGDASLSYAQQRWYDPRSGRFLSEDPVFGHLEQPNSLHPFDYANGNPTRYVDPNGEFVCWMAPGLCDKTNLMLGYLAVRSVLGEENQKRLDEYAGKAIQNHVGVKSLLASAQQKTEKVIDDVAYVKGGGTTLGNLEAARDSAAGKFVARTAFGIANMAISSPEQMSEDLAEAHVHAWGAAKQAADSSLPAGKRIDAASEVLGVVSQDLLMVAGTAEAVGFKGPAVFGKQAPALPTEPVLQTVPDKWSRNPKSIQDQMTLNAAKEGAGEKIIENLGDSQFDGMEKWEYRVKSANERDSVVHYVRDPESGELLDFKFKKHSTDARGKWEGKPDPKVPPGGS
jgi:RHS repeat-associated protein